MVSGLALLWSGPDAFRSQGSVGYSNWSPGGYPLSYLKGHRYLKRKPQTVKFLHC